MAYEFKLPDIGEGVVEGEIVQWMVQPGDTVAEDQPVVEIMTDKATVAIPSPKAGTVLETRGDEGEVIAVGDTLVVIDTGDGAAAPAPKAKAPSKGAASAPAKAPAAPKAAPAQADTPPARLVRGVPGRTTSPLAGKVSPPAPRPAAAPASPAPARRASPSLRREARARGVDVATLMGAAPTAAPAAVAPRAAPQPPYNVPAGVTLPPPGGQSAVPYRGLRKKIAERMQAAKNTAAHFTFVEEVDMRRLVALRDGLKAPAAAQGVKLNYLPFFVKAACLALKRHPQLNLRLDEAAGEIVYQGFYNIGIAAATERGLVVPVVKDADQRSLFELSAEIQRLADAARDGKLSLDELQGSTFTITSLGQQGGLFATPVINMPNVAIMGPHLIKDKPIVDKGEIVPGKVMLLSLSFDHRLVDGHVGAAFAYEIIQLLEAPEQLLLELP